MAIAPNFERIRKLAIVSMFSDDTLMQTLVLKGGNALDLVYGLGHRASLDIDLSIADDFSPAMLENIQRRIQNALTSTFDSEGLQVFDVSFQEVPANLTDDRRPFWGGYRVEFKVIEKEKFARLERDMGNLRRQASEVGPNHARTMEIEISKHEWCNGKVSRLFNGYTVYVYSPEMLVCEKLRAICQQMPEYAAMLNRNPSPRPKDFFDIYTAITHFKIDLLASANVQLLIDIFAAKRVPVHLLRQITGTRDFHETGFPALRQTVRSLRRLKDFSFYFDYVVAQCNKLETLWEADSPST